MEAKIHSSSDPNAASPFRRGAYVQAGSYRTKQAERSRYKDALCAISVNKPPIVF